MSSVSIVISALNEPYINKTIDTLLQRTPYNLIDEIVVVDDYSDRIVDLPYPKTKILRNKCREGLIRSRQIAIESTSSPIIISIDPHVKVGVDWLRPIIERLEQDHRRIVIPVTSGLDPVCWMETGSIQAKTGWAWNLDFYWCHDDKTDMTPAFAGHCFAFMRRWWSKVGGFDMGMYQWGGENIEFSLRTWLSGGSVEIVRESSVAHWFKNKFMNYKIDNSVLLSNKARIAEVWFDKHKTNFYRAVGKDSIDFGNISDRLDLRHKVQCKPFEWFIERFQPELFGIGKLHNKFPGSNIAIIGASPSIDRLDTRRLADYDVVIGVNYIAMAFDCDFVVFHDAAPVKEVISSGKYNHDQLIVPMCLKDGIERISAASIANGLVTYRLGHPDSGSTLDTKIPPFFHHASTVHTAAHFAAFLGARTITLFGCDARFTSDGRSHTSLVPQYNGGYYWPKNKDTENYLNRIEKGYKVLYEALNKWNISIIRVGHD